MAIYQVFVKLFDGRTQCLQFPTSTLCGEDVKRELVGRTGVPLAPLRLVSGTRQICDDTVIAASPDGFFPSLSLLPRLPGGKGGFHSLLRAAGSKAGQKKTDNFDACRDMSGRRIRHVNAERKLEGWMAAAEERKLEKLAEDFLKKKANEAKKKNSAAAVEEYLKRYREETEKCMKEMEEAVRQSSALHKESKRRILPLSEPYSKRPKIWIGNKEESDSDSGSDSEDEEEDGGDNKSTA